MVLLSFLEPSPGSKTDAAVTPDGHRDRLLSICINRFYHEAIVNQLLPLLTDGECTNDHIDVKRFAKNSLDELREACFASGAENGDERLNFGSETR